MKLLNNQDSSKHLTDEQLQKYLDEGFVLVYDDMEVDEDYEVLVNVVENEKAEIVIDTDSYDGFYNNQHNWYFYSLEDVLAYRKVNAINVELAFH